MQALENAGAICLGKTNLDQFATGLNGTRSPYGVVPQFLMMNIYLVVLVQALLFQLLKNKFVSLLELIQVDQGIPAAMNNIIGLKPTKGTLSTKVLFLVAQS